MLNQFPDPSKPVVLDLFSGLWGWSEGFIANGWNAIGIDLKHPLTIPRNALYGQHDVLNFTRYWLRELLAAYNIRAITASPPCQEFSYFSMPWSRAKQIQSAILGKGEFPLNYNSGSRNVEQLTRLFRECFRIQHDLCELAGKHIPLVIENVNGAQKWVGKAKSHFGSYYLWGDVPAIVSRRMEGIKVGSEAGRRTDIGKGARFTSRESGVKQHGSGREWFAGEGTMGMMPSGSHRREQVSALIAKIPFSLSSYIAKCLTPMI